MRGVKVQKIALEEDKLSCSTEAPTKNSNPSNIKPIEYMMQMPQKIGIRNEPDALM